MASTIRPPSARDIPKQAGIRTTVHVRILYRSLLLRLPTFLVFRGVKLPFNYRENRKAYGHAVLKK